MILLAATAPGPSIADIIIPVLLGLLVVAIGIGTLVLSRSANREQVRAATSAHEAAVIAVDADAYKRAREIYESALNTVRADLTTTRAELHELRLSNEALTAEIGPLRVSNVRLQAEITLLREEIARLTEAERKRGG